MNIDLKSVLGIQEFYELNEKIKDIIFDETEKNNFFDRVLASGVDLGKDFLRDLFQEEAAARKSFKQDYSPDCICELFALITEDCISIYDECAGTGSLSIGLINKGIKNIYCIELSGNAIPILLFNLAIRNVNGYVIQGDVLGDEIKNIYKLNSGVKYSEIKKDDNFEPIQINTIISNPPYSLQWSGLPDDRMIEFDIPPKSKADYLFILDMLYKLEFEGQMYVLLPHGVLFRGGSEQKIRKKLIDKGYLRAIIGLPGNLFMNTPIPTVLMHLVKKEREYGEVFIMDASKLYKKQGKVNNITDEQLTVIADSFKNKQVKEKLCRVVPYEEIRLNDYNLNIPRYIDTYEQEAAPDLKEVVRNIIEIDNEIKQTEHKLSEMMKEIVGGNYQQEVSEVLKLWRS